ncbi:MAG TPA: methytransferase partner Trm112 [Thermoplasmata archaeon]|nr:methytransferase partner Trm112 [Thermoplasmata archaeon]
MKEELMEILVCPLCKAELVLKVEKVDDKEVLEGSLTCTQCQRSYPVEDGIPNLLPPER